VSHRPEKGSWKVLVLGNSVATMVVPNRRDRSEGTYGEVLERSLRAAGTDVTVINSGRWYDLIDSGVRRFMEVERTSFADVLVIQYGINECQPNVLPTPLNRHFVTWDQGLRRPSRVYRARVAPVLWRWLRGYQRWASNVVGMRTWRMKPARFEHELRRLIGWARAEQMLVLVLDINPPGDRLRYHLPGVERRAEVFQELLARVVSTVDDPDVRLVPVSEVVAEMGEEAAIPDGLHYSAPAHVAVAELLAAELRPWLGASGQRPSNAR
jgi:lysophospholipase L1-like esterase